ncbi:uncharacterized protein LOC143292717 [Babylonia areolata]|uniref:uncharacterized protein LOC143292717 n=1 Tax=Babylonia areolata TaxID=304850 RepID=UPI003FD0BDB1
MVARGRSRGRGRASKRAAAAAATQESGDGAGPAQSENDDALPSGTDAPLEEPAQAQQETEAADTSVMEGFEIEGAEGEATEGFEIEGAEGEATEGFEIEGAEGEAMEGFEIEGAMEGFKIVGEATGRFEIEEAEGEAADTSVMEGFEIEGEAEEMEGAEGEAQEIEGIEGEENEEQENLDEHFNEGEGYIVEEELAGEEENDDECFNKGPDIDAEELVGEGADDDDGEAYDQEDDEISDISWVEELWNRKKAEEAQNAQAAEGEEPATEDADFAMDLEESEERLDFPLTKEAEGADKQSTEPKASGEEKTEQGKTQGKTTEPVLSDQYAAFPESSLEFSKMNACIPRAYFGPAFDANCFHACIRIYPTTYVDFVRPEFAHLLTQADTVRMVHGAAGSRKIEIFCQRPGALLPKLYALTYCCNNITFEVVKRRPLGWKKILVSDRLLTVPSAFSSEEFLLVKLKMMNSYYRRNLIKVPSLNRYQDVKERSLFLTNLPFKVNTTLLRQVFPFACKISKVPVSDTLSSAVVRLNTHRSVLDHLVAYEDLHLHGQKVEMAASNMSQKDAQMKLNVRKAGEVRARNQARKTERTETKETQDVPADDATKGSQSRAGAGESEKLSPEEQEKREQERKEKERKAPELKEKERRVREKTSREQRDRERARAHRERLERERPRQQSRQQKPASLRNRAPRREPLMGRKPLLGRRPLLEREPEKPPPQRGGESRRRRPSATSSGRRYPAPYMHGMDRDPNMQMLHEIELQHEMAAQRERELQRDMEILQDLEMVAQRQEEQKRREREAEERRREQEEREQARMEWEWEERERHRLEQARLELEEADRRERERREREDLQREKKKLERMHEEAMLKLKALEDQQRREQEELQRLGQEMEAEKVRMQRQMEEERRRQRQEREEWERLSRKRGHHHDDMGGQGVVDNRHSKKGRGEEGGWGNYYPAVAPAGDVERLGGHGAQNEASGSLPEVAVKRKLELEVARQAEELKMNLALLDKIQKDPTGISASLSEVLSSKDKGQGGHPSSAYDAAQQPGHQQLLHSQDLNPQQQQQQLYGQDFNNPAYGSSPSHDYTAQYQQSYGGDMSHYQHPHGESQTRGGGSGYQGWQGGPDLAGQPSATATWGAGARDLSSWTRGTTSGYAKTEDGAGGDIQGRGQQQQQQRGGGYYDQGGRQQWGQQQQWGDNYSQGGQRQGGYHQGGGRGGQRKRDSGSEQGERRGGAGQQGGRGREGGGGGYNQGGGGVGGGEVYRGSYGQGGRKGPDSGRQGGQRKQKKSWYGSSGGDGHYGGQGKGRNY